MFSNMVNFWFVSIFYMVRVKSFYIYRYRFLCQFWNCLRLPVWYQIEAMLISVNQSTAYASLFFLLVGFKLFYSNLFKHPQNRPNPNPTTFSTYSILFKSMNYFSMLLNDLKKVLNNSTDKTGFTVYCYRGVVFKWQRVTSFDYSLSDATRKCNYLRKIKNNHIFKVDYSY